MKLHRTLLFMIVSSTRFLLLGLFLLDQYIGSINVNKYVKQAGKIIVE